MGKKIMTVHLCPIRVVSSRLMGHGWIIDYRENGFLVVHLIKTVWPVVFFVLADYLKLGWKIRKKFESNGIFLNFSLHLRSEITARL